MSMDKAIKHGKEHRKPYYRSGRFDRTCRPHGGCPYCVGNRKHSEAMRIARAEYKEDARQL
jgi:hypothetical protein